MGGTEQAGASTYVTPPTCASLLQPQPLEHLAELVVLAEVGQLDVDAGPQPGAKVGRTGEHVAQVLIPHELVAALLEQVLDLQEAEEEEGEGEDGGVGEQEVGGRGLTLVNPVQKRLKTSLMLPPFCMLMTLRWSSSLTHTRKVLLSLCLQVRDTRTHAHVSRGRK